MEGSKGGNLVVAAKNWATEKQEIFTLWLGRQSVPVEAVVTSGLAAVQGGVMGALLSSFNKDLASSLASQQTGAGSKSGAVRSILPTEGAIGHPLIQARNFAVLTGVNAGISCVLKRVRGVDDVQNSMAAAFASGFIFSLVGSSGGPSIPGAVGTGTLFALFQGGIHKLGQMTQKESSGRIEDDDVMYVKGRSMLKTLGLDKYEKNLRDGSICDASLPLLTDSLLKEASIPPGPRLIILDHIHRNNELGNGS